MQLTRFALLLTTATVAGLASRAPRRQGEALLLTEEADAGEDTSEATKAFLYPGIPNTGTFNEQRDRYFLHKARDWVYNVGYAKLPTWSEWILHVTMSWVIFMLLCLMVWMNAYPDDPDLEGMFSEGEKADPVKTFTEDHFGCLKTPKICFCACVCPALRWADNINMAGFMRVPVALGIFFMCSLANGLTGTFCYTGIMTCFLILYYRHRLRDKLGLPAWMWKPCCADFFFVFCCSWCAIAQEARVVRYAYQQGTLSLATGKRYGKSELPDCPFPRVAAGGINSRGALLPPPEPASMTAQRLVAEGHAGG